jgi:hypothetical protein
MYKICSYVNGLVWQVRENSFTLFLLFQKIINFKTLILTLYHINNFLLLFKNKSLQYKIFSFFYINSLLFSFFYTNFFYFILHLSLLTITKKIKKKIKKNQLIKSICQLYPHIFLSWSLDAFTRCCCLANVLPRSRQKLCHNCLIKFFQFFSWVISVSRIMCLNYNTSHWEDVVGDRVIYDFKVIQSCQSKPLDWRLYVRCRSKWLQSSESKSFECFNSLPV